MLRISEAASLGLHAAVVLAGAPERRLSAHAAAARLGVSEAHLAKVLRRLVRAGILHSSRGPGGGFALETDPSKTRLLDVYEAVEGPLERNDCLLSVAACGAEDCILGGLAARVHGEVVRYLEETTLWDVAGVFDAGPERGKREQSGEVELRVIGEQGSRP